MPIAPTAASNRRHGGTGAFGSLALRAPAILVVSAAAAVAISLQLRGGGAPPHGNAPPAEVHWVPPAQAAAFAILRRPLRQSDAFTAVRAGSGPVGANPALARTLAEPRGSLSAGRVSVVPANGSVCLRVPFADGGGAQWWCQTLAAARRGALVMALRPAGPLRASEQLLVGLVPDGVRTVAVTTANGQRFELAVRDNVYDAQLYAPRTIAVELPGGVTRRLAAP